MEKSVGNKKTFTFGTEVLLNNTPLFRTSTYPASHRPVSGKFFLYDGIEKNGRFKITTSKRCVRFKPEGMVVIGWVNKSDILKLQEN